MTSIEDHADPFALLGAWLERNGLDEEFDDVDRMDDLIDRWNAEIEGERQTLTLDMTVAQEERR